MSYGSLLGITHGELSVRKQKGLDQGQCGLVAQHELGLGTGESQVGS